MKKISRSKEIIPPWEMPTDPVKAVLWFLHWSLKVLVRLFWLPIIVMVVLETYQNWRIGGAFSGIVGGVVTLLVTISIWGILYLVLLVLNISTGISHIIEEVNRVQQTMQSQRPSSPFSESEREERVVESTITDLEEERRKRKRE